MMQLQQHQLPFDYVRGSDLGNLLVKMTVLLQLLLTLFIHYSGFISLLSHKLQSNLT